MSNSRVVFLRLAGPMQAWGERSHWGIRHTSDRPTKSGVIGIIGCAAGIHEDEKLRFIAQSLRMGIRVNKPGVVIKDYHTVVTGALSAEGGVKGTDGEAQTVLSERYYLCDADFLVALIGSEDAVNFVARVLQVPVNPPYLGRACCIPSLPIIAAVGIYDSLTDALAEFPYEGKEPECVAWVEDQNGDVMRHDMPFNFHGRYLPRFERKVILNMTGGQDVPQ